MQFPSIFARFPAALGLALSFILVAGCDSEPERNAPPTTTQTESESQAEHVEPTAVIKFCGDCHAYPSPTIFSKTMWPDEVERGFGFYTESGRSDLEIPNQQAVREYYVSHAPETIELPPSSEPAGGPLTFEEVALSDDSSEHHSISHLKWYPGTDSAPGELLISNMSTGQVSSLRFDGREAELKHAATVSYPAHTEKWDFNRDRKDELLIAELGSFLPEDHIQGKVYLGIPAPEDGRYWVQPILENVGRVADVRPLDADQDGDLDLIVAVFGWRKTGELLLLLNRGENNGIPRFERVLLDKRHGASHIPVADFNGDGAPDFVALFSQEHERIVHFTNQGNGEFAPQVVFAADNPAYGFSSLKLFDLDGDGDEDLLVTNGDSMDSHALLAHHSIQWLENRGQGQFEHHTIDQLPGAYCATAGDLDRDGDLDIVACAMTWKYDLKRNSLVWYEQTEPGRFVSHPLDFSSDQHAAVEVGDFDGDGDLDIATGHFLLTDMFSNQWLSIWWNQLIP